MKRTMAREKGHALLSGDGLELYGVVGVHPSAGGAALVEVLLDMVPAEPTDLASHVSTRREGTVKLVGERLPGSHKCKA